MAPPVKYLNPCREGRTGHETYYVSVPVIVPNFIVLGQTMYGKMCYKKTLSVTDRLAKNSKQRVSAYCATTITGQLLLGEHLDT